MIGTRIHARRKALKMTQDMLSKDLCDRSYLSKLEANKVSPTLEFLEKVSARLQMSLQDLIGEEQKGLHILNEIEIRHMIRNEDYEELWKTLEMLWWQSAGHRSPALQQSIFTVVKSVKDHVKSFESLYSVLISLIFHGIAQGINENTSAMVNFLCQVLYDAHEYTLSISLARAFLSLNVSKSGQIEIFLGIALNLIELQEWPRALDYYSGVLEPSEFRGSTIWKAKALHGVSTCEIYRENWQAASQAAHEASQLYLQSGNESLAWLANQNTAISLCAENKLHQGLELLHSCHKYWNAQQDLANRINVLDDLVSVWERIGDRQSIREVIVEINEWPTAMPLPGHLQRLVCRVRGAQP